MPVAISSSQVSSFLKTVLPPLLARYVWRLVRVVLMTPQGRMVGLALLALLGLVLAIPVLLVTGLMYLLTQDAAQALAGGALVALTLVSVMMLLGFKAWQRWRKFRSRHF